MTTSHASLPATFPAARQSEPFGRYSQFPRRYLGESSSLTVLTYVRVLVVVTVSVKVSVVVLMGRRLGKPYDFDFGLGRNGTSRNVERDSLDGKEVGDFRELFRVPKPFAFRFH